MQYLKKYVHKICCWQGIFIFTCVAKPNSLQTNTVKTLHPDMLSWLCVSVCICMFKFESCVALRSFLLEGENRLNILNRLISCGLSSHFYVIVSFTTLHIFFSLSLCQPPQLHLTCSSLVNGFMATPVVNSAMLTSQNILQSSASNTLLVSHWIMLPGSPNVLPFFTVTFEIVRQSSLMK